MATLYHAPLACSLAARFAAAEGDVDLEVALVDLSKKQLATGGSFYDINPLGQVAVLALDDGAKLTETAVILSWIQAQSSSAGFHVDPAEPDYFQLLRWLGFCGTELHKGLFRVVFYQEATEAVKDRVRALVPSRFAVLEEQLVGRDYLLGDHFTAADAYLAWFFVLSGYASVTASELPNLDAYKERVLGRPKIKALIEEDRALDRKLGQNLFSG